MTSTPTILPYKTPPPGYTPQKICLWSKTNKKFSICYQSLNPLEDRQLQSDTAGHYFRDEG